MREAHPITIVVAVSRNGVIGLTPPPPAPQVGRLPWRIRSDFRHFKSLTAGGTVIMGRRTFESLGPEGSPGGLPDRLNIVVSSKLPSAAPENPLPEEGGRGWVAQAESKGKAASPQTAFCRSLVEAIAIARNRAPHVGGVFIIGGESIFCEALEQHLVDRVEITDVDATVAAKSGETLTRFPAEPHWSHDPASRAALGWRLVRERLLPANPAAGDDHACWFRTYDRSGPRQG